MPSTPKVAIRCLPLLLLAAAFAFGEQPAGTALFQVHENGRTGFINSKGDVVIKPIFRSAGEFSEGLASARIDGLYGFIDATGEFVIEPQFDFATHFSEGLAVVFKDELPIVINRSGKKAFDANFAAIEPFKDGRARVRTTSGRFGVIDGHGKLIVDTDFTRIEPFTAGVAAVQGNAGSGVIDSVGKFIIPFGKYESIASIDDGYLRATIAPEPWDTVQGYTKQTAILDRSGKLVLSKSHKNKIRIDGTVSCGLVKMNLYKYWLPEKEGTSWSSNKSYEGFMNVKGEIVINDTTFKQVYDFSDNRAFVKNEYGEYLIIDTLGQEVSTERYSDVIGYGFKNGVALVRKNGLCGMIDTNGNFVINPKFEDIHPAGIVDEYFFFREEVQSQMNNNRFYGIARKDGTILLDAMLQNFDPDGFKNGLLMCVIEGRLSYIDRKGKIIWQDPDQGARTTENVNIDYMNRGYFYAWSEPAERDNGGFGTSRNIPSRIPSQNTFAPNTLSVIAQPHLKTNVSGSAGSTVIVANTTKSKIEFNAQDSRLNMKVQAKDHKGQWRDIEYLPSSWCGNSYHTLTLDPKQSWTFSSPAYEGGFATKLRVQLTFIDPSDKSDKRSRTRKEITIYSNEYDGSVNPGQFWRKPDYSPAGIMDPYFD